MITLENLSQFEGTTIREIIKRTSEIVAVS